MHQSRLITSWTKVTAERGGVGFEGLIIICSETSWVLCGKLVHSSYLQGGHIPSLCHHPRSTSQFPVVSLFIVWFEPLIRLHQQFSHLAKSDFHIYSFLSPSSWNVFHLLLSLILTFTAPGVIMQTHLLPPKAHLLSRIASCRHWDIWFHSQCFSKVIMLCSLTPESIILSIQMDYLVYKSHYVTLLWLRNLHLA